jgi:hypothetical protein
MVCSTLNCDNEFNRYEYASALNTLVFPGLRHSIEHDEALDEHNAPQEPHHPFIVPRQGESPIKITP